MERIFLKMPCLSESKEFGRKEIYERLFDKQCDKRYLESAIQKFITLNKKLFDFIGIDVIVSGTGHEISMKFVSSGYIGAVPIRMPYNGIAFKDFQVIPRFDNCNNVFSELTQLLNELDFSISPEFMPEAILCSSFQLRPPQYLEAVRYINLFDKALRYNWQKFSVEEKDVGFPKSTTRWDKYSERIADPVKALSYPVVNNVLTKNHKEMNQLKYVFDLAMEIISNPSVPSEIRYKYLPSAKIIQNRVCNISSEITKQMQIKSSDPILVKEVKKQANVILKNGSTLFEAWRMDMPLLFERYTQMIVSKATADLYGKTIRNHKIYGNGFLPAWGLKYLEPDIFVVFENVALMADAKYKAHFISGNSSSEILKATFRSDLHQLLAYCSFEPQKDKAGVLFYPSNRFSFKKMSYYDAMAGININIIICGLPFGMPDIADNIIEVKTLIQQMFFSD